VESPAAPETGTARAIDLLGMVRGRKEKDLTVTRLNAVQLLQ
jgi:hypothetical protein